MNQTLLSMEYGFDILFYFGIDSNIIIDLYLLGLLKKRGVMAIDELLFFSGGFRFGHWVLIFLINLAMRSYSIKLYLFYPDTLSAIPNFLISNQIIKNRNE